MKKRRPRTTGSELYFDGAHQFGREISVETPAVLKLSKRLRSQQCLGCGHKSCKCRSKK